MKKRFNSLDKEQAIDIEKSYREAGWKTKIKTKQIKKYEVFTIGKPSVKMRKVI